MARLEAWFDRLRASWARLRLRACDVVGPGARVIGAPHVENRGRIELGRGFVWSSVPVRSHFVVGPHGVLRIGDDVHIAHGAALSVDAEVTIGDGSVLGPFVTILDSDYHEVNHREAHGEARAIHIGRNVRLYQAVTLGAKRFETDAEGFVQKGGPRHPIVEDDVVIYAGATILGRVTVGRGSVIGGNVWVTRSVPPGSQVTQARVREGIRTDFVDDGAGI